MTRRFHGALVLVFMGVASVIGPAQSGLTPSLPSGLRVSADNRYFDVFPRVVPANRESTIAIVPRFDHVRFRPDCQYELTYSPAEQIAVKTGWKPKTKETVLPRNGRLEITRFFEAEQEHTFAIQEIQPDKKQKTFCTVHIYSLEPDLYALRPFKGDFHMHNHNSDGVESPAYVAGACRRAGLDFMALTDHRQYRYSVEAMNLFRDVPIDLKIFPGEEVHPPDNPIHIVSFGAKSGITDLYRTPEQEKNYREEVAGVQAGLKDLPDGVNPYQYASCLWAAARIRERGGLSMFAHSYWYVDNKFGAPGPLRDLLLKQRVFDVMELISGSDLAELNEMDTNSLQVARYHDETAKGNRLPIAGISDAHGVEKGETFGRYYTICFAPSVEFADLAAGIRDLRSVAVEAIRGDRPRPFGPFRLVKYAHFLLREILPQHDELCFEEGRRMIQHAGGDTSAFEVLGVLKGQVARLYDHYWGKQAPPGPIVRPQAARAQSQGPANAASQAGSPIEIRVPVRRSFAALLHRQLPGNQIGYRFQEHVPLIDGPVPRDNRAAGIDPEESARLEKKYAQSAGVVSHTLDVAEDGWAPQTWTYYLLPVSDGVELLLKVETREAGVNSYYGIQQCFRLSGETNLAWRQEIAKTPAFSEFDCWAQLEKSGQPPASLTRVLRGGMWESLPARPETVGARTPLGLDIDRRRTGGNLSVMPRVGPYEAEMLQPIDDGLITRVNLEQTWVCGIYWEGTSHVSVHHPADCLHSIVNIGGIPRYGKRLVRGKIYWFPGTVQDLARKWRGDFPKARG